MSGFVQDTILDRAQRLLSSLRPVYATARLYREHSGYVRVIVQKSVPVEWVGKEVVILPRDQYECLIKSSWTGSKKLPSG